MEHNIIYYTLILYIWNKYKQYFAEDFKTNKEMHALNDLNEILKTENFKCSDFGLPDTKIMKAEIDIGQKKYILINAKQNLICYFIN